MLLYDRTLFRRQFSFFLNDILRNCYLTNIMQRCQKLQLSDLRIREAHFLPKTGCHLSCTLYMLLCLVITFAKRLLQRIYNRTAGRFFFQHLFIHHIRSGILHQLLYRSICIFLSCNTIFDRHRHFIIKINDLRLDRLHDIPCIQIVGLFQNHNKIAIVQLCTECILTHSSADITGDLPHDTIPVNRSVSFVHGTQSIYIADRKRNREKFRISPLRDLCVKALFIVKSRHRIKQHGIFQFEICLSAGGHIMEHKQLSDQLSFIILHTAELTLVSLCLTVFNRLPVKFLIDVRSVHSHEFLLLHKFFYRQGSIFKFHARHQLIQSRTVVCQPAFIVKQNDRILQIFQDHVTRDRQRDGRQIIERIEIQQKSYKHIQQDRRIHNKRNDTRQIYKIDHNCQKHSDDRTIIPFSVYTRRFSAFQG